MAESKFLKLVNNGFLFRLYLLKSLPIAFIAGVRVQSLTSKTAIVVIKHRWINQNPFRSMYFACQGMAAEMTTGLLALNSVYGANPSVLMLIIKNTTTYTKKAVGKITFTCEEGEKVSQAVLTAKKSGESVITDVRSVGTDETGDTVAEFIFTWSFKQKTKF